MQSRPAPGGFGRKVNPDAAEIARRREQFIAAERARQPEAPRELDLQVPRPSSPRPGGAEKSILLAYVLWFGLSTLSAHRFYLGFTASAMGQASMWFVGWLLVVGGEYIGLASVLAAAIWMLVDAFLIPGLVRKANERRIQSSASEIFA
jgi:TM2 domain-containing membrane protein YozV